MVSTLAERRTRGGGRANHCVGDHLHRLTDIWKLKSVTLTLCYINRKANNTTSPSLISITSSNSSIMSAQTDFHSSAPSPNSSHNIAKDIELWRRRTLNASILIAATATWVLMQVYQLKFITVFSWLAMLLLASSFLWANMLRLVGKEPPSLSGLEMTEQSAMQMAYTVKAWSEEGIRLMFRLSAEEGWPLFLGLVAGLLSLSYIGSKMDLLTFLYMGIIVSTTVPVIYVKNEDRIKSLVEWLKAKSKRSYEMFDERAIQKIKSRVISESEMKKQNEKKAE